METNKIERKTKRIISRIVNIDENIITKQTSINEILKDNFDQIEVSVILENEFNIIFEEEHTKEIFQSDFEMLCMKIMKLMTQRKHVQNASQPN